MQIANVEGADADVVNELGYEMRGYGAQAIAHMEFGAEFDAALEATRGDYFFRWAGYDRRRELISLGMNEVESAL